MGTTKSRIPKPTVALPFTLRTALATGLLLACAAQVYAQENTATVTPTTTPTRTPSATPPEGCQHIGLEPDAHWITLAFSDTEDPPEGAGCIAQGEGEPHILLAGSIYSPTPPPWFAANMLIRWDTSEIPLNGYVTDAWLRLWSDVVNDDDFGLTADWYDWGATCDGSDHTNAAPTSALSQAGACGAACDLANVAKETDSDFRLDDADAYIDPNDTTALRLHVGGSQMPTGENGIASLSLESGEFGPPPRLIMLICGADTPTPTVTPTPTFTPPNTATPTITPTVPHNCQMHVFNATAEYVVSADVSAPTPAPEGCDDEPQSLFGDDPAWLFGSATNPFGEETAYFNISMLLAWDTSSLPAEDHIVGAWVRARVAAAWRLAGKRLAGDWHDWSAPDPNDPSPDPNGPDCDSGDFSAAPPANALSVLGSCGAQCYFDNISSGLGAPLITETGADQDFELDNVAYIDPDGQTYLRLHVDDEPLMLFDVLAFAPTDERNIGPRLVVLTCENEPTCGNGLPPPTPTILEPGETCDDGNTSAGDGCSPVCRNEFPTPTPTASATATPTSPPGCQYVTLEADDEQTLNAKSYSAPPLPFSDCDDETSVTSVGNSYRPQSGERNDFQFLLGWDTSAISSGYPGYVVQRAWLRATLEDVKAKGEKALEADWYPWSAEVCDPNDLDPNAPADALSPQGACGHRCRLKHLFPGGVFGATSEEDFELDDAPANVNLSGSTYLRLHVDMGPVLNYDGIEIFTSDSEEDGPRLVLQMCPDP